MLGYIVVLVLLVVIVGAVLATRGGR